LNNTKEATILKATIKAKAKIEKLTDSKKLTIKNTQLDTTSVAITPKNLLSLR
jgi:hypothetical protein